MIELSIFVVSVSISALALGLAFMCFSLAMYFREGHSIEADGVPVATDKPQEGHMICSDGEVRPMKQAVAFEESLVSGDVPSAGWDAAVTRFE